MKSRLAYAMIVFFSLASGSAAALADGISGTYVGRGSNAAFLLQIVETADGHLTGRYEQVVLQPNGKLDDSNAGVTGAADGQTVVVTIKPNEFLSGSLTASGTIEGRLLHITGGGNGGNLNLNLVRSDEADFRAQVTGLAEQARQIGDAQARAEAEQRRAKVAAEFLVNIQNLTARMSDFVTKADAELPKFAPVEQRYRDITQRMRGALAREQSIYGGGQASVARGQISVAINQASVQANQIEVTVQSAYQDFNVNSGPMLREAADMEQSCHRAHVATDANPVQPENAAWNSACLHFADVAKKFRQRVSDLREAFAHIGSVWNTENRNQEEIVQASNVAVQ